MRNLRLIIVVTAIFFSVAMLSAQDVRIPQIGIEAPKFKAESTNGMVNFPKDFGDHWKILFSHPKDFTPVCSSEIYELAQAQDDFEELDTKIVVISTDILKQHESWKAALEEISYKDRTPAKINFPLVADNSMEVSKLYGMIHSKESISKNVRGVYFIDPDNTIRAIYFYPNEVGRSVDEIKRTLVSLQNHYANKNQVTPANWELGDDVLIPVLTQEEKAELANPDSEYYQIAWFMTFLKNNKMMY